MCPHTPFAVFLRKSVLCWPQTVTLRAKNKHKTLTKNLKGNKKQKEKCNLSIPWGKEVTTENWNVFAQLLTDSYTEFVLITDCKFTEHINHNEENTQHKQTTTSRVSKDSPPKISTLYLFLTDLCHKPWYLPYHVQHVTGCRLHLWSELVMNVNTVFDKRFIVDIW